MKPQNYFITAVFTFVLSLSTLYTVQAQPHHHHHHRPHWVAVHHCDVSTRFVFFPEHNFYYDVVRGVYIYPSEGAWIYSEAVPSVFAHIDLALVPIIELDINIERPFIHNHDHLVWYRTYNYDYDYVRYYRGHGHHGHYAKHSGHPRHGHYGYYDQHKHGDKHSVKRDHKNHRNDDRYARNRGHQNDFGHKGAYQRKGNDTRNEQHKKDNGHRNGGGRR